MNLSFSWLRKSDQGECSGTKYTIVFGHSVKKLLGLPEEHITFESLFKSIPAMQLVQ